MTPIYDFSDQYIDDLENSVSELSIENEKLKGQIERFKIAFMHAQPEKHQVLFICGTAGEKDKIGLPEYINVCPVHGLDGFAMYKKYTDYSATGW
jgi:hypothetical protein